MAVLAMLFAEPGIIEVIPPLIECLRLLPYDPRSFGMTIRARGGSAHVWIGDAFMWRRRSVRTTNLSVRRHMATRAGDADGLTAHRAGARRIDDGCVDVRQIESFR